MAPVALVDDLREIVGPTHVLTGDLTVGHRTDWTGRWTGACLAVVRPATTDEAASVVARCGAAMVPVVPQGGNTGLVGGAVPEAGSVVVSTTRLSELGQVDPAVGQVTAGAGVTLAALAGAAERAGWRYPVDFAARDTATVGGTIATNAGGHHVLRYGMTRRHVVGVEVVLADGRVLSHLAGLVKDNTGYDLPGLFCGSEGTLGIITRARLALSPPGGERAVALVGLRGLDEVADAVGRLRRSAPEIEALELMTADGIGAVARHLGVAPVMPNSAVVLLVEVVSREDPDEVLLAALGDIDAVESAVATDRHAIEQLWRWRESHTEVINNIGPHPPHKFDVSVHPSDMPALVDGATRALRSTDPAWQLWVFGHAGDGNLHLNVTGPAPDDDTVDAVILELVAALGGSISAEHGIGRAKRPWLHLSRSAPEIETFRALKAALDPHGLLNPGVLLP
jgi:FAD/FMN-containing dehydrogenase